MAGERPRKRVFISGIGILSPLGNKIDLVVEGLRTEKSGLVLFEHPYSEKVQFGGPVTFDPTQYLNEEDIKFTDRYVHMVVATSIEGVAESAKLSKPANDPNNPFQYQLVEGVDPSRVGVDISVTTSTRPVTKAAIALAQGKRHVPIATLFQANMARAGELVAKTHGTAGDFQVVSKACSGGIRSILNAWGEILLGNADAMIAGASDSALDPVFTNAYANFSSRGLVSTDNANYLEAIAPFSRKAKGTALAEGAALVVLESEESVKARGVTPIAEILGGAKLNVPGEGAMVSEEGYRKLVKACLKDAQITEYDLDFISPHGPSTGGDGNELLGYAAALPVRGREIPISSFVPYFGHAQAAKGAIELVATIGMLRAGFLAKTLNHTDPEVPGFNIVTETQPYTMRTGIAGIFKAGLGGGYNGLIVRVFPQAV